ncbi:MAG: AarF/ABC1/UbiB kinase family protein, partial [Desulfosalsimonadaceae bacterium]|nr:AarF/ABC1/UbiB kinase family protein [Desulfosalsimonadaceae bacterium]
ILSEIRRTVLEECNFKKEAENIEIFSKLLEGAAHREVVTPKVYHQASSKRVLTMERLYGIPLTRRKDLLKSTENPFRILGAAFQTWMESITGCELFHADLHAGNILILGDGRVGFIDFGIVGRISEKTQEGVNSLIKAMMVMDYATMAESMLAIGMTRKKVNTGKLAKDLEDFYISMESPISDDGPPADITDLSEPDQSEPDQALLEIVRIAETHGIRFPREFTLLLKQFLYFDSYRDILFDMGGSGMEGLMDEILLKMEGIDPELLQ